MPETPLNFGEVTATESITTEASLFPHRLEATAVLVPSLLLLLALCVIVLFLRADDRKSLSRHFLLSRLPVSAKAAITLTLLSFGFVHLFSILTVFLKTQVAYESAQSYFYYMPIHKLAALSHAHFFGHGAMYILLAIAFLWTSFQERLRRLVLMLPPVGAILDNASWWGMKLISPGFEFLSMVSGIMMLVGFIAMSVTVFVQMWFQKYAAEVVP